jgi:hypothetical protein
MVKRAGAVETGQAGGAGEPELVASFCAAAGTSSARTQPQASQRQRRFMETRRIISEPARIKQPF